LVKAMREELYKVGVEVSMNIDHSQMGFNSNNMKYAFIGGSNSGRTAAAMRELGKEVMEITESGWRVNEELVKKGGERSE
jgi:hypothetical protein